MAQQQAPKDQNDVSALLLTDGSGNTMRWLGDPVTGAALVEGTVASGLVVSGATPTPISGGSGSTNFLYDNNGVLAEGVPTANITIGSAVSGGNPSQLLATDSSTNLQNLAVATYPSLTEISYVKGVTSAIQTQLNGKQASGSYLTATTGITVDQSTPQTIGATGARLTKLWATDITVTNAIVGGVTGNAGTVTNATLTTALTVNTGTLTLSGNAANTSVMTFPAGTDTVVTLAATQTLTNKRVTPRILSAASYTTDTGSSINGDTLDSFIQEQLNTMSGTAKIALLPTRLLVERE